MKFTSLALAATLMFAATAQANESVIRKALTQQFPGAQIASVTKTPYSGLFEVYLDGQLIYVDAKAQYVFAGDVIDLENRTNLSQARLNQLQAVKWDTHYGVCGGCSFQHVNSSAQIRIKQDLLAEQFKRRGNVEMPEVWQPLEGPHWGYRRKARMGVKYVAKKNRVLVGFRERRHPYLAEIDSCIVMHPIVGTKLTALGEMIAGLSIRDKIPQIEVAIGDEQCVLSIRVLEPPTDADQQRMKDLELEHNMTLCLQSKGPDTIAPLDGEAEVNPMILLPMWG